MTVPLVSVCMITYNHEDFIVQAIRGVLMQNTNFKFEFIVCDDASQDKTVQLLNDQEVRNPNCNLILTSHKKNLGMMPNFIFALQQCKGTYIALCEGDDYWTDPFKLQKQVDFLRAHPEYVITYHNAKVIDGKGTLVKDSKLPDTAKKDYSAEELMKARFVLTLTMCYRNCLDSFPPEFKKITNGDSFLTSLLGQHGKGKYLDTISPAVYRAHPEGIWSNLSELNKLKRRFQFFFYMTKYYSRLDYPTIKKHYLRKFDKLFHEYKEAALQSKEKRHIAYANRMFTKSIYIDAKKSRLKRIIKMWLS